MEQSYLEFTYDKFYFRVDSTCKYFSAESWAREHNGLVVIGVTDFLQINSGDAVFIELSQVGTVVAQGDEVGTLETIKTTVAIASPVSGEIIEVNELIDTEPEQINEDPYGEGWLFKVRPSGWENDIQQLLSPEEYYPIMVSKVEAASDK